MNNFDESGPGLELIDRFYPTTIPVYGRYRQLGRDKPAIKTLSRSTVGVFIDICTIFQSPVVVVC